MLSDKLRFIIKLTAGIITFSYLAFYQIGPVEAYQNPDYFKDLKIGLVKMSTATMTVKLSGDYLFNGTLMPTGSLLNVSISNSSLIVNGISYSSITLTPKISTNLLSISNGTETNNYMGSFTFQVKNSKILPINSISMENYLKGVVGFEMSDSFPIEALKTQAVAARTYALANEGACAAQGYDFDDTINYQVYAGYVPSHTRVIQAIDATKGQVVTYNDNLINAVFSASHGGYTADVKNVWGGTAPYLIAKSDVVNGQVFDNAPWSLGNKTFKIADINTTLKSKGYILSTDTFLNLDLNSIVKDVSGRVISLNIVYKDASGITKSKAITLDKCRTFLNLQSSMWNITYDSVNGSYTFSGKGYGHGLGMSQIGAKQRATFGQTYDQILAFYYDATKVENLIQTANISSYTASSNEIFLGQTANYTAVAQGGSGQYQFKFGVMKDGVLLNETDYSSSTQFTFNPTTTGSYQVYVKVKDNYSDKDYDNIKYSTLNVQAVLTANISNFTESDTQALLGQKTIFFNALGKDGTGTGYLYKYEISKNGTVVQSRDFSSDGTVSIKPTDVGTYTATVYVKDALSTAVYDSKQTLNFNVYNVPTISTYTIDKTEVIEGQGVNLSADSEGGSSSYLYKYVVSKDGATVNTRDYSQDKTFAYTPNDSGNYKVTVYMKDAASTNDYDVTKDLTFTADTAVSISNLTLNSSEALVGQSINANTVITGGSGNYQYKYEVIQNGIVISTRDFSTDKTFVYAPTNIGDYSIKVSVKDIVSSNTVDGVQTTNFKIYSAPQLVSFTSDKNEIITGDVVNFNSQITGGSGNTLYRYVVYKDGQWYSQTDFGLSNTFSFMPQTIGNYQIYLQVKDRLETNVYSVRGTLLLKVDSPAVGSETIDKSAILMGQSVNLVSNATGGSGSYQYKYEVIKNGTIISSKDFSTDGTLSYTPTDTGDYSVKLYVKDMLSFNNYDDVETVNFTTYSAPQLVSTTVDKNEVIIGDTINYNVQTSGGSGNIQYRYVVYKDGVWFSQTAYGSSTNFTFTPQAVGNYQVYMQAKDALETNLYSIKATFVLKVDNPAGVTASINKNSTLVGQGINVSAVGSGGSSQGYLYKYDVIKDGTIISTKDFSNSSSFNYIPSSVGNYVIRVYTKDIYSYKNYDSSQDVNLTAYSVPQITSATASGYMYEGKAINLNSAFTGGSTAGVNYRYEIYKDGALVQTKDYDSVSSYSFTPAVAGNYTVKVFVKDGITSSNFDNEKDFTLVINKKPLILSQVPLYYGITSQDVVNLQNALISLGYSISSATGFYGSQTQTAITTLQTQNKLTATGKVDAATLDVINNMLINKAGTKNLTF